MSYLGCEMSYILIWMFDVMVGISCILYEISGMA